MFKAGSSSDKESACNTRDPGSILGLGRSPGEGIGYLTLVFLGFSGGSVDEEAACNVGDLGLIPGLERFPGGGNGNPLQDSCLENSHGEKDLAGCSPWGCKKLDTTEQLSTHMLMSPC